MIESNIHFDIAEARAHLRTLRDEHTNVKAIAEQEAITTGTAGGKNAEERERSLTIALVDNMRYQNALTHLRDAEGALEELEAQLESIKDLRREREWTIRARLADALLTRRVQGDAPDPASDGAFDDVADTTAIDDIMELFGGRE